MNPCPCEFFTNPKKECRCIPHQIQRYISKISGPLLDRIGLHLEVPALSSTELLAAAKNGKPADNQGKKLLKMAIDELGLSVRSYDKT